MRDVVGERIEAGGAEPRPYGIPGGPDGMRAEQSPAPTVFREVPMECGRRGAPPLRCSGRFRWNAGEGEPWPYGFREVPIECGRTKGWIMLQELIQGAANAIAGAFGPKTMIYTEMVRQNLKRPCFFIEGGDLSEKRVVGNRYLRKAPLSVTYFPSEEKIPVKRNAEMAQVAEKLFCVMENLWMEDGSILRGTSMRAQNAGEVLRFSAQYGGFVTKLPDENPELMGDLTLREGV